MPAYYIIPKINGFFKIKQEAKFVLSNFL